MRHNPGSVIKHGSAVLLFLAAAAPALAHDEKNSVSRVEIADGGVVWRVDVSLVGLQKVIRLPAEPLDLTDAQFQGLRKEIFAYLSTCMKVAINGAPVEPEVGPLEPLYEAFIATGEKYIAHARQEFRFRSTGSVRRVLLSGAFFRTLTEEHHAILNVDWNGSERSFSRTGAFDLELTPTLIRPTFLSTGGEFLVRGMKLSLASFPQIAFLLALLLGVRTFPEALRVVISYLLALDLSLVLEGLDRIRLSSEVTATLVAASVVYVAAENYWIREARHRWLLAFTFGLVHGLGYADGLRGFFQDQASIGLPVAASSAGVTLGNLAIALVALPLFAWLRGAPDEPAGHRRHRLLMRAGSVPILLLGCFWTAVRFLPK